MLYIRNGAAPNLQVCLLAATSEGLLYAPGLDALCLPAVVTGVWGTLMKLGSHVAAGLDDVTLMCCAYQAANMATSILELEY